MGHSIAIVDDEPDSVQLFKDILSTNGYNVVGFTNPLLVLEHIQENEEEYDLILSDYKMTPINGCDLAKKFRKTPNQLKLKDYLWIPKNSSYWKDDI